MEDADQCYISDWITLLHNSDIKSRIEAIHKLTHVNTREARHALIESFQSEDPALHWHIFQAFKQIKDPLFIPPLLDELKKNPSINLVDTLGFLGDPRAILPLINVFTIETGNLEDIKLWDATADALIKINFVLDPLINALNNGNWQIRAWSALTLGRLRNTHALPALIALLSDTHTQVRAEAVKALGTLDAVQAQEHLIVMLRDEDAYVRKCAIWALRTINNPTIKNAIKDLVWDKDTNVQQIARGVLAQSKKIKWFSDK